MEYENGRQVEDMGDEIERVELFDDTEHGDGREVYGAQDKPKPVNQRSQKRGRMRDVMRIWT